MFALATAFFGRLRREEGQALVEYALILALIAVAAVVVLGFLGADVDWALEQIESQINGDM